MVLQAMKLEYEPPNYLKIAIQKGWCGFKRQSKDDINSDTSAAGIVEAGVHCCASSIGGLVALIGRSICRRVCLAERVWGGRELHLF